MRTNTWREGAKRIKPGSFQWCPVTGQVVMHANWDTAVFPKQEERLSLCGWLSTGTGCPEKLSSLIPWRYSKAIWMWSSTACSGVILFEQGTRTRWPSEVPSNLNHFLVMCECPKRVLSSENKSDLFPSLGYLGSTSAKLYCTVLCMIWFKIMQVTQSGSRKLKDFCHSCYSSISNCKFLAFSFVLFWFAERSCEITLAWCSTFTIHLVSAWSL